MRFTLFASVVLVTMTLPGLCQAKSDTDARITRLENIVENELNIGLLNQIESLQTELRELQGKIEEQENTIHSLTQKQDKLFLHIESRLDHIDHHNATASKVDLPAKTEPEQKTAKSETIEPVTKIDVQNFAYDTACKLMHSKQYAAAIDEFKDLIWQNPAGPYAADAHYWLGEIYLLQWGQDRNDQKLLTLAKDEFNSVAKQHADHPKAGEALLKLGLIEIDLKHWPEAKDILTQIITKEPNTSRARIAESKLQRLQSQGHI